MKRVADRTVADAMSVRTADVETGQTMIGRPVVCKRRMSTPHSRIPISFPCLGGRSGRGPAQSCEYAPTLILRGGGGNGKALPVRILSCGCFAPISRRRTKTRSRCVGLGLIPQLLTRQGRAVAEGAELGPGDLRVDAAAEAAVGSGDDVFSADDFGKNDDAVGYEFRVLD